MPVRRRRKKKDQKEKKLISACKRDNYSLVLSALMLRSHQGFTSICSREKLPSTAKTYHTQSKAKHSLGLSKMRRRWPPRVGLLHLFCQSNILQNIGYLG